MLNLSIEVGGQRRGVDKSETHGVSYLAARVTCNYAKHQVLGCYRTVASHTNSCWLFFCDSIIESSREEPGERRVLLAFMSFFSVNFGALQF